MRDATREGAADTFALVYQGPETKLWYYLPTVPEARKWRGPYDKRDWMDNALFNELGDATVTETTLPPHELPGGVT